MVSASRRSAAFLARATTSACALDEEDRRCRRLESVERVLRSKTSSHSFPLSSRREVARVGEEQDDILLERRTCLGELERIGALH